MLWYLLGIFFFLCGCNQPQTAPIANSRMVLSEAIQYGEETPVNIIAKQAKEIDTLKKSEETLSFQLSQSTLSEKEAREQLAQTQNQLAQIKEKYRSTLEELHRLKEAWKNQEENIQKLTIDKLKLEQSFIQLKIQQLQKAPKEEE
ncbi:MAG: hypothetical protein HUU50_20020 [Candidatus Brocadiae bacterium]|nr:hypothetical protein [Candidatus Brocadiia bacterium]